MVSVVQGDDWRRVRNTITPAFTAAKLKKVGKLSFMVLFLN